MLVLISRRKSLCVMAIVSLCADHSMWAFDISHVIKDMFESQCIVKNIQRYVFSRPNPPNPNTYSSNAFTHSSNDLLVNTNHGQHDPISQRANARIARPASQGPRMVCRSHGFNMFWWAISICMTFHHNYPEPTTNKWQTWTWHVWDDNLHYNAGILYSKVQAQIMNHYIKQHEATHAPWRESQESTCGLMQSNVILWISMFTIWISMLTMQESTCGLLQSMQCDLKNMHVGHEAWDELVGTDEVVVGTCRQSNVGWLQWTWLDRNKGAG